MSKISTYPFEKPSTPTSGRAFDIEGAQDSQGSRRAGSRAPEEQLIRFEKVDSESDTTQDSDSSWESEGSVAPPMIYPRSSINRAFPDKLRNFVNQGSVTNQGGGISNRGGGSDSQGGAGVNQGTGNITRDRDIVTRGRGNANRGRSDIYRGPGSRSAVTERGDYESIKYYADRGAWNDAWERLPSFGFETDLPAGEKEIDIKAWLQIESVKSADERLN